MNYFAKFGDVKLSVDLLIEFVQYKNNILTLTKKMDDGTVVTVKIEKDDQFYKIYDRELPVLKIPLDVKLPELKEKEMIPLAFKPPLFGGKATSYDRSNMLLNHVVCSNGIGKLTRL